MIDELRVQTLGHPCSAGVFTQTTDVETERNGLMTVSQRCPNDGGWMLTAF